MQDHYKTYSWFPKLTILSFIFQWSTIYHSSLARPSCLLSRQIGLRDLVPSVGRFLKLPLSLLAFSKFLNIIFRYRLFKGVPHPRIKFLTRVTGHFFYLAQCVLRGSRHGRFIFIKYAFFSSFFQCFFNKTLWRFEVNRKQIS